MYRHADDLDRTRAAIVARDLVPTVSAYLTQDIAVGLPFEDLAGFKTLLKRFFSDASWTDENDSALAALVTPHGAYVPIWAGGRRRSVCAYGALLDLSVLAPD